MVPKDDGSDNVVEDILFLIDQLDAERKEKFLEKLKLKENPEKAEIAKVLKDLNEDPESEAILREMVERLSDKPGLLKKVKDALEVPTWIASFVVLYSKKECWEKHFILSSINKKRLEKNYLYSLGIILTKY